MRTLKRFIVLFIMCGLLFGYGYGEDKDIKKINKYFKMDLQQLLKVEMSTAGKKMEKISDIPASVVVLTREEIELYGYRTLPEILENIPGLYITNDYWTQNAGIRGFWSFTPNRNVIILVNNVPLREEFQSSYYLESIIVPVEAIDRIEVVRGPMSALYGNGAFFGVINIITNHFEEEEDFLNNMVTVSAGSDKTGKIFARSSGKSGDFQYTFNGSYMGTRGQDVSMDKLGATGLTGALTTDGLLEGTEKYFSFSGSFKDFTFDASYAENRKESVFLFPPVDDGGLVIFTDMRFTLEYKRKLTDTIRLESKFGYFKSRTKFEYDLLWPNFLGIQENGSSGFKAGVNLFITASDKLDITVGIDYLRVPEAFTEYSIPFFQYLLNKDHLADDEAMVTQSIFAQVKYAISEKFQFVAGAMLEQTPDYIYQHTVGDPTTFVFSSTDAEYSHTKAEFIPRLALIYSLDENNVFKFLYGKAINRPAFFQNIERRSSLLNDLLPESIQTLELNYVSQVSSALTVNLSIFRNMLDSLLYRSVLTGDGTVSAYFANIGEMTTLGGELTVMCSPS
ncbi:MAG: TonB-dependent receptor, partial [bacterium]|nr:TonB-dependent receptor [bacterium]